MLLLGRLGVSRSDGQLLNRSEQIEKGGGGVTGGVTHISRDIQGRPELEVVSHCVTKWGDSYYSGHKTSLFSIFLIFGLFTFFAHRVVNRNYPWP